MRRTLLAAVALLVLAAAASWYAVRTYDPPGPLAAETAVDVPRGGLEIIADALQRQGVIGQPLAFRAAALLTRGDGPLHAGELEVPAGASLRQVLAVLRSARAVQHHLTVPEGLTAAQVAVLVDRADAATGNAPLPDEGWFLPETYSYERGVSRQVLVERGRTAMERALDRIWVGRDPAVNLATSREALILASIVERETARPEERPRVAAVFLNRLRLGMKLQSDPTVAYGANGGLGVAEHPITRAELERDDPYNTYRIPGLPPGPICMPGAASLHAVTHPARTNDLFFVADGSGGHAFARTLDEHGRNVVHWRQVERARAP